MQRRSVVKQFAEKDKTAASGVKTPDENGGFMSELKLRPPKIRPFFSKLQSRGEY
jgi:hypothetical protein